ncbi:MAG: glycosyltransferase family 4 protein, partial [Actinobacteria bacterium]|nr:glycosyltransferase family 4 protein [Actinomycetota bacterium]
MPEYKLLIIIQKDPLGEGIGGMHTFIKGLVKHLPDDFKIELVGITTDKTKRPVGKWQKIKFSNKNINFFPVLYRENQNKSSRIPLSFQFSLSLLRYRPRIPLKDRILEFHRVEPAFLFRNSKNIKVVFIHGNVGELYNPFSEIKWHNMPWLYFQLEKMVMPGITRVYVVSQAGLDFYRKRYKNSKDKFSFLPTWVDKDIFYPLKSGKDKENELKKFQISSQDKILLFAGRLVGSKNPLLLIDSFRKIYDGDKKVKLLIVGDGGLKRKILDRIDEHGLQEKVILLGILSQDRLSKLMRACDLFVLTSACE